MTKTNTTTTTVTTNNAPKAHVYFRGCKTIEDVKGKLIGYVKDVKDGKFTKSECSALISQYRTAYDKLSDQRAGKDGTIFVAKSRMTDKEFCAVAMGLAKLDGLNAEYVGTWLWVTGNTKANRAELKAMGFRWMSTRQAWALMGPSEESVKKASERATAAATKSAGIEDIRAAFAKKTTSKAKSAKTA